MTSDREADALSSHLLEIAIGAAHAARRLLHPVRRADRDRRREEGFLRPRHRVRPRVRAADRRADPAGSPRTPTIVGEEGGQQGSGAVQWYVDPIDGTNNFVAGIPFFTVSIAAALDGRLLAGVVYDPSRQETFAASVAGGATLNGEPMRCTAAPSTRCHRC